MAAGNNGEYRFADFVVDPSNTRNLIYAIQEDHTIDEPSKVVNSIVSISLPRGDQVLGVGQCTAVNPPCLPVTY